MKRVVFAPTRASQGCRQFATLTLIAAIVCAVVVAAWSLGMR